MPQSLGDHSPLLAALRELRSRQGRTERGVFAFEGPTLLREALDAGVAIRELYVTAFWLEDDDVRTVERSGTAVYAVSERAAKRISDVDSPTGIVALAPLRLVPIDAMLSQRLTLVLADINDPGNAGALVRSAEAFGAAGVIFGESGVDPYHPKVIRSAMGALFRVPVAVTDPTELGAALGRAGATALGLDPSGLPLAQATWPARGALVVGHERHGLGAWNGLCGGLLAIPMHGRTESLNAAIAGSIALYQLSN